MNFKNMNLKKINKEYNRKCMKQFLRPSLGVLDKREEVCIKVIYGEKRKEIKVIYLNVVCEFWIKEKRYVFHIQEFEEK